jgi:hypothetical protein
MAMGDWLAIVWQKAIAEDKTFGLGTIRSTNPILLASGARIVLPVNTSSNARD